MLNEIHIEGAVTRTWTFQDVHFARIACRVDSGRIPTSETGQRESEYITLRFEPPALARAASTLKSGNLVRVTGYLSSREYNITLKSFAKSADGDKEAVVALQKLAEQAGDKARKPHVLNEVVVERFEVLEERRPPAPQRAARRRGQRTARPVQAESASKGETAQAPPEA